MKIKRNDIDVDNYIMSYLKLSAIIPILLTIALFIIMVVLNIEPEHFKDGYLDAIYTVWTKYYYNGNIDGISSWRIHLAILICGFVGYMLLKTDNGNGNGGF